MRTFGILLFTLILSGFSIPRCGATVYYSNGSVANVQALHNAARDGDTITLPAGIFSWTARLNITKGITIQGQTTISGAGTANPIINDRTIIQDNTPRSGIRGILSAEIPPGKLFRFTGMTFVPGATTAYPSKLEGAFHLGYQGATPSMWNRIDHCHFASLYQGKIIWVGGWVYGVADHNVIEVRGNDLPFNIWAITYGGTAQILGHGSWADYPWYGTDKFWFVEDNTIIRRSSQPTGLVDSVFGGRFVIRHNYVHNAVVGDHGTEGSGRGKRANEVYNNTFNNTATGAPPGGQRSGTSLWHDNIVTGIEPNNDSVCGLQNFRESPSRAQSPWGIADGTSPWDANDTEGNGTFVEGHQPFVFDQGTDNSSVNSRGIIHDSTKNWTPNQWVGYSVTNYNRVYTSDGIGSYITGNTAHTITYDYYPGTDATQHMIFNAGDPYKIHRVLIMMDQNGRGKTDLITGSGPFINTTTGTASWPHSALEPCFSWNNVYAPNGNALGFNTNAGQPTTIANRDYYNLGAGFPRDSTPAQVSATYTAALNGVDYVGTFVYPHPLTALPIGAARAVVTDFSGEGSPDYVLQRASTHQTGIWYLDNNVYAGSAWGPTLPPGWELVAAADFNGDGKPDYLLYNVYTQQTGIYYLNNNVYVSAAWGPTVSVWSLFGP